MRVARPVAEDVSVSSPLIVALARGVARSARANCPSFSLRRNLNTVPVWTLCQSGQTTDRPLTSKKFPVDQDYIDQIGMDYSTVMEWFELAATPEDLTEVAKELIKELEPYENGN